MGNTWWWAGSYGVTPPVEVVVGAVDRSLSGHRLAASQPDIGSNPTHILPFHSLKAKEACTEGTTEVTPTEPSNQLNRRLTA